jgi:uncharacterized membrane protein YkvA (DUF1232 family)
MSEIFNINLSGEVLRHFEQVIANETKVKKTKILKQVDDSLQFLKKAPQEKYVTKHICKLEEMIAMLKDTKWNMKKKDKKYVLAALSYFVEENDIIPDEIPVVGFLDDCIVIDIVTEKIIHELEAYRDFKLACKIYGKNDEFSVSDWLQIKRKELFSRMRSRRNKSRSSYRTRGTSFTI